MLCKATPSSLPPRDGLLSDGLISFYFSGISSEMTPWLIGLFKPLTSSGLSRFLLCFLTSLDVDPVEVKFEIGFAPHSLVVRFGA